ncbi:MAG: hypothetical protein V3U84_07715 [Thiotrichaceae bacterium]
MEHEFNKVFHSWINDLLPVFGKAILIGSALLCEIDQGGTEAILLINFLRLYTADECFLAGTGAKLIPVREMMDED